MTGNNLDKFFRKIHRIKYLKFIWEYEKLEIIGRYVESMESNYSPEIENLKTYKGISEVCYDSFCYEVLNNVKSDKIYMLNNTLIIEISVYDYPDKILTLDNTLLWNSLELESEYKIIIDEIRKWRNLNRNG